MQLMKASAGHWKVCQNLKFEEGDMDLKVFINSLFSWGDNIFIEALELEVRKKVLRLTRDADEAHYLERDIRTRIYEKSGFSYFPYTQKLTRTEIVSYIDRATKGFNPIYTASLLEDVKDAAKLYYAKILKATRYVQEYVVPIIDDIIDDVNVESTFDTFQATSGEACSEALCLDNSLYHYAVSLLSSDTTPNHKKILPPELDTPRSRKYFGKALEAGLIAKTSTGYKWTMTAGRGAKVQLAYFCSRVFCPGGTGAFPENAIDLLFGVSRIGAALTQAYNAKPQKWRPRIDSIFED